MAEIKRGDRVRVLPIKPDGGVVTDHDRVLIGHEGVVRESLNDYVLVALEGVDSDFWEVDDDGTIELVFYPSELEVVA